MQTAHDSNDIEKNSQSLFALARSLICSVESATLVASGCPQACEVTNSEGQRPLEAALSARAFNAARGLARHTRIDRSFEDGNTAMHLAASMDAHEALFDMLSFGPGSGKAALMPNQHGITPLIAAAMARSLLCVEMLLPLSDPLATDAYGRTAEYWVDRVKLGYASLPFPSTIGTMAEASKLIANTCGAVREKRAIAQACATVANSSGSHSTPQNHAAKQRL